MKKTALVINPWVTDFKLYDEWMHPLGLYFLIDRLEKSGYTVNYFNCLQRSSKKRKKNSTGEFITHEIEKPQMFTHIRRKYKRYGVPDECLKEFLLQTAAPDLICVGSMMTYWLYGVSETIKCIRCVHPSTPLIAGGIGVKLFGSFLKRENPDCLFPEDVPGLLNSFHVDNHSLIAGFSRLENPLHAPVLTTLGCPLSCSYCASSILQPHFFKRSKHQIIDELLFMIDKFSVRDFSFYDDALLIDGYEVLCAIRTEVEKRGLQLRFYTPNGIHAKFITTQIAEIMHQLNFNTIRIGYESGNHKHRQQTADKASVNLIRDKIEILGNAGFKKKDIGVYLMAGLDNQSPEEFIREMRLLSSMGAQVKPVYISPIPGTSMFKKYALKFPQLHSDPHWHNDTFFITKLPGWSYDEVENISNMARVLNQSP